MIACGFDKKQPFARKGGGRAVVDLKPSQALPRQLPRRGSQAVTFVAKVLGIMRRLPGVLLPLPLGEVALRSKDGEGARREKLPQSRCARQPPLGWGLWHNGTVSG